MNRPHTTIGSLYARGTEALLQGDFLAAIATYTHILHHQPHHLDARLRLADSLLSLGHVVEAATIYAGSLRLCARLGYPLRAMVCLKILYELDPSLTTTSEQDIATLYSAESAHLGPGTRQRTADADQPCPAQPQSDADPEHIVATASHLGATLDNVQGPFPQKLLRVPLLSELSQAAFVRLLQQAQLRRVQPLQTVIAQGTTGNSFFLVARGTLQVSQQAGPHSAADILATVSDGAVIGEMALLAATPRSASVIAVTDCDLLEFDREALITISHEIHAVSEALENFRKERLLQSLMQRCALFKPLTAKQKIDLMRRFVAHDIDKDTVVVAEGQPVLGLYAILHGEVEVYKHTAQGNAHITALRPADIFGEISLIDADLATASVITTTQCTLMFLAADYFRRLIAAMPEVRHAVETIGEQRLFETQLLLAHLDETDV